MLGLTLIYLSKWTPGLSVSYDIGMILGLHPANERRRYKVTPSLIGWAQAYNQPWDICFLSSWHFL